MSVQNILREFVSRATLIDKRVTEGSFLLPEVDPEVYGPGVGARAGVGKYVDTGQFKMGVDGERLWTDKASWCTIVASYDPPARRSFLAHLYPQQSHLGAANTLKAYKASLPKYVTLCTMPVWLREALSSDEGAKKSSLWSVVKMFDLVYSQERVGEDRGAMAVAHNTTIITGYRGIEWDQYCGVAVESYGIFPMAKHKEDWLLWYTQFEVS